MIPLSAPSLLDGLRADAAGVNHLLAALPASDWHLWAPDLEPVHLRLGDVLIEAAGASHFVYFPTTAVVSLMCLLETGACAEAAGVGREGIVGVSAFLGGNALPCRAVVQIAGEGFRFPTALLGQECDRSRPVLRQMLRYAQTLLGQMAQAALCNRHHAIDQQLCRLLLLCQDRCASDDLVLTQELIANALGVRREGVTEAALGLQTAGLIRYARGHIKVIDRDGLRSRACECYEVIRRQIMP